MSGDIVQVLDDIARVHELQKDHPGWLDDMALVCMKLVNTELRVCRCAHSIMYI